MSKQSLAHEYVEWTKQKLDEIDATLAALDGSVEALKADARTQADRAIARIRAARDAFQSQADTLRSDTAAAKAIADDAYIAVEAEWAEVELAFRDFLTAAAGQASVVRKALAARAAAQRQSWQSSLQAIRASASAAIDHARGEGDAAIRRLIAEAEKAEAKLGKLPGAGDESWKAIKGGLKETVAAYDRTWKKISEAVAKIG
jgi:DNA repair exonuclease SbcCD ATPase subunit